MAFYINELNLVKIHIINQSLKLLINDFKRTDIFYQNKFKKYNLLISASFKNGLNRIPHLVKVYQALSKISSEVNES